MATNPYFTQLHTQRFSFIGSPQQRDGTTNDDQRFLNMYPELIKSPLTDGKKYYLKKRPGVSQLLAFPAGRGQGIFYWEYNNTYYYAIGGTLYYGPSQTPLLALSQSNTNVGFAVFRGTAGVYLVVVDGIKGWVIGTNNTFVQITSPNFPSPHIPSPIFMDGYIFLAGASSQAIFNSTLNDPNTWPSDGFIDAEMYPDNVVQLAKQQNYIVAIGSDSVEFLYDNANATGSPLQRNAPAVAQIGCPAPLTVCQTEDQLIMVGTTQAGGRTVWQIKGFQPAQIASEPVREALDEEGDNIINATAMTVQCAGHKWYILNLEIGGRTFVYDFEEQMWHEWSTTTGQARFNWQFVASAPDGFPVLLGYTDGVVAKLSPDVYTDLGAPINCQIVTSKIDFDTDKRKRMYRLSMVGDSPVAGGSSPMTLEWSDDDYNTWVGSRQLQMNGGYPTTTQLGYFRRRAFRFTYIQPHPLRLESFEVDITQEVRR